MYFIPTKSLHNLKSTKSRHICTIDTLRGMDDGNLSRSLQMELNLLNVPSQINYIKLGMPWYYFSRPKLEQYQIVLLQWKIWGALETMAPVYFFLTIDQRFPFNFNYLCLSIVRPPRYLLTKNDHNLVISSFLHTHPVSLEPISSSTLFLNTRTEIPLSLTLQGIYNKPCIGK